MVNLNNQKYTITIKNKTNDPTIEKVSKIQVTTYCVKDNSKTYSGTGIFGKEIEVSLKKLEKLKI